MPKRDASDELRMNWPIPCEIDNVDISESNTSCGRWQEQDWSHTEALRSQIKFGDEDEEIVYDLEWFANSESAVQPVEFSETIVLNHHESEGSVVEYCAMLYSRELSNGKLEYLLVASEDRGDEGSVELMLGVDISEDKLSIFGKETWILNLSLTTLKYHQT